MIWLAIAGMCAATYVPRIIPLMLGESLLLPALIRRWLSYFPYAAIGALIFPGILGSVPKSPWIGVASGALAFGISWKVKSPMVAVLAAIALSFVLSLVF
jgi:branched-subunit amino acid transport protein